jgi:hypothetical protein
MRRRKDGPPRRFQRRSVRVVFNIGYVWRPGVEAVLHVFLRELRESASLETEVLDDFVYAFDLAGYVLS